MHCLHVGYVGLMGNLHYFQILDFLLGWFGLDVAGDDYATRLREETRLAAEAAAHEEAELRKSRDSKEQKKQKEGGKPEETTAKPISKESPTPPEPAVERPKEPAKATPAKTTPKSPAKETKKEPARPPKTPEKTYELDNRRDAFP